MFVKCQKMMTVLVDPYLYLLTKTTFQKGSYENQHLIYNLQRLQCNN